ncbi:hypothetical protein MGLY_23660 [Neomoorella glycerini]|uniref:Uncharacterized protein n=1 Tax=Neomoorella glycerini TaxID=55779 RepID=A0A6I5ZSE7_9FIRM|nr:hypothetical protein MGLY_23660 [Moorella glycerini]
MRFSLGIKDKDIIALPFIVATRVLVLFSCYPAGIYSSASSLVLIGSREDMRWATVSGWTADRMI